MPIKRPSLSCLMLFVACVITCPVSARDTATEQFNVTAATREMEQSKSDYAAAGERVKLQTQRVSQEQARLKEDKLKLSKAKTRLFKAQANLDTQKKALDKAWNRQ